MAADRAAEHPRRNVPFSSHSIAFVLTFFFLDPHYLARRNDASRRLADRYM
jgi:hypothetical protein